LYDARSVPRAAQIIHNSSIARTDRRFTLRCAPTFRRSYSGARCHAHQRRQNRTMVTRLIRGGSCVRLFCGRSLAAGVAVVGAVVIELAVVITGAVVVGIAVNARFAVKMIV